MLGSRPANGERQRPSVAELARLARVGSEQSGSATPAHSLQATGHEQPRRLRRTPQRGVGWPRYRTSQRRGRGEDQRLDAARGRLANARGSGIALRSPSVWNPSMPHDARRSPGTGSHQSGLAPTIGGQEVGRAADWPSFPRRSPLSVSPPTGQGPWLVALVHEASARRRPQSTLANRTRAIVQFPSSSSVGASG